MNLPFVLDVAIGLVLIFLLLSLLVSEIQELLATLLQWRAKHLKDAIENLLAGGVGTHEEERVKELVNQLYDDPLIKNINQEARGLAGKARGITRWLIPGNRKGNFGIDQATGPSYIAGETFATSLLERLGLASLSKKLIEVRLEKFATRIIGIYDGGQRKSQSVVIPGNNDPRFEDLWNKGRLRLIAEKAGLPDLKEDQSFQVLVEEFDDILNDFETGEANLNTSVERMGESFSNYVNNYLAPESKNEITNSVIPKLDDLTRETEANLPAETVQSLSSTIKLDYFIQRLQSLNLSTFGKESKRAVASEGLRPSLLEIAKLLDQTSATYKEVTDSYQDLLNEGKVLDKQMMPLLQAKLLADHLEIVEQQLVEKYPQNVENLMRQYCLETIQRFETRLKAINDKLRRVPSSLNRRSRSALGKLVRQKQRLLAEIFDQVHADEQLSITIQTASDSSLSVVEAVLDSIDPENSEDNAVRKAEVINHALNQLSHENRHFLLDEVLTVLSQQERWNSQTSKQKRSLYENYQTYQGIQLILSKLPNSVKESFAILARRAQTRVQQTGNNANQFREEVGIWFDRSMSRATGVYKRNTKGVGILIGLLLAVMTNIDTAFITNRLSNDENLRRVVTEQAIATTKQNNLEDARNKAGEALEELALPIGWSPTNFSEQLGCDPSKNPGGNSLGGNMPSDWSQMPNACLNHPPIIERLSEQAAHNPLQVIASSVANAVKVMAAIVVQYPIALLRILFGWLIAGVALSMGAPFWFDLLNKIVNVRNSGGKPPSTENQTTAKISLPETTIKQ